jgi:putative oxidoreductase
MTPKNLQSLAPLPLRLILGIAFMIHGYPKLFTLQGHQQFVELLGSIGVPLPFLASWLLGSLEFLGGLCLLVGLLVVPVSILLTIHMLVALLTVHLSHGFNFINIVGMTPSGPVFGMPGYEVNLLYIGGLLSLVLSGPGALAAGWQRADDEAGPPSATGTA